MPFGSRLEDFHEPPRVINARNAEDRYWQDFAGKVREALPPSQSDSILANTGPQWNIREVDALIAAGKQQLRLNPGRELEVRLWRSSHQHKFLDREAVQ